MKAILVFDINEFTYEAIKDWFTGVITLHMGNDGFIDFKDVLLKPIPQKESENHREEIEDWTGLAYSQGYNACLDDILGETE